MSDNPMDHLRTRARLAWRLLVDRRTLHVPPGHPYSPLPSTDDVDRAIARSAADAGLPGIDLNIDEQLALLDRLAPLYADLPFTAAPGRGRYHYDNDWFMFSDGVFYALMLRHLRPRRVVEVGSGWSSALALDVGEEFLDGTVEFTFVDPDPRRLRELLSPDDLRGRLVEAPVQDVPLARFTSLESGDVLFIDSSHVLKAGSDVQYLLDDVLPRLRPGVHVHIHDVLYPFEYPAAWLRSGTALNEAYAVRLLLQHTRAFRVVLWNSYLHAHHRDWLAAHLPLTLAGRHPTGGIWLRREE